MTPPRSASRRSRATLTSTPARPEKVDTSREDEHGIEFGSWFEPLPEIAVPAFLESYGYAAKDLDTWVSAADARALRVKLKVNGHKEYAGFTMYIVKCELADARLSSPKAVAWEVRRRLSHLRQDVHDVVKKSLGERAYLHWFSSTPFAYHGGLPGTTARLSAWLGRLADVINEGGLTPRMVARVLNYIEAPSPETFVAGAVDIDSLQIHLDGRPVGVDSVLSAVGAGLSVEAADLI